MPADRRLNIDLPQIVVKYGQEKRKIMAELTEIQSAFVSYLVLEGCNPTEAARRAGYSHPKSRSWELLRKPHIIAAIREEQTRILDGDLANIAMNTLRNVMENENSPASSRVAASRAVLEASGYFRRSDNISLEEKDPLEMTTQELEVFIAKAKAKIEKTLIIAH